MLRWRIAILVAIAIAINYLDRLTLPSVIDDIRRQMDFSSQAFALLNTAFLGAYGAMYLVGGKLMDFLGTRRGFAIIIVFWSLACASHVFAIGLVTLVMCRLLLGIGEGGGFPAATRVVAEWFPVKERSTAMGIINGATGVGGMVALPLVSVLLYHTGWLGLEPWRWVFFITGSFGILWLVWWLADYFVPEKHRSLSAAEREYIQGGIPPAQLAQAKVPLAILFQHKETWGIVVAKFLTDAAWYFILFWLPTYLNNLHKTLHPEETSYNFAKTASVAWIPHASAFVGCLIGGSLSSLLIQHKTSVNSSRKVALFLSAIIMPLLILVPYFNSTAVVIALLSAGYFGQQSWSTLVMVLPTDLYPRRAVGTVAGLVGLGGALGGVALGQFASYLLDHKFSYRPVMLVAGLLHVTAFIVILLTVRKLQPLELAAKLRAHDTLQLALKLQVPAVLVMLLGLIVVQGVMGANYLPMIALAGAALVVDVALLAMMAKGVALRAGGVISALLALAAGAAKVYFLSDIGQWDKDHAFAASCVAVSVLADGILFLAAGSFLAKPAAAAVTELQEKAVA